MHNVAINISLYYGAAQALRGVRIKDEPAR